jgi:hypothetical protein
MKIFSHLKRETKNTKIKYKNRTKGTSKSHSQLLRHFQQDLALMDLE